MGSGSSRSGECIEISFSSWNGSQFYDTDLFTRSIMESGKADAGSGLALVPAPPAAVLDQFFPPCIHVFCGFYMVAAYNGLDPITIVAGPRRQ